MKAFMGRTAAFLLALCLLCAALPAGTARAASNAQKTPLPVIVSIAAQKYMVERIAGDAVSVAVLVKPGADPHSYEPTPAQMRQCAEARFYFTIGVPFEDVWLPRISGAAPNLAVVSTISGFARLPYAEAVPTPAPAPGREKDAEQANGHTDGHDAVDPHVWLSPMLVRQMLPVIVKTLGKALPERAAEFRENARKFSDELEALDQELAKDFAAFPPERRAFLTFHPSWGYFARNYQLIELSIETEGKEPGPKTMKAVIDAARARGISSVFVEPQFPKSTARAIADSIGATVVEVDPLSEDLPALYRDVAKKLVESFRRQRTQ